MRERERLSLHGKGGGVLIKTNYNWSNLPATRIEFKKLLKHLNVAHYQDLASLNSEVFFVELTLIVSL